MFSELGSGTIPCTEGRQIIHFGSPDGAVYSTDATVVKSNISVKDWVNRES